MMHSKKIPIIILFLLIIFSESYAQGLLFDSSQFYLQKEYPQDRAYIPGNYSLEKYLPALYPQTGGTCVAMSIAMARTIMYAISTKMTDKASITRNQMSPYYIYYNSREKYDYSCERGLNPINALNTAKNLGFEKLFRIEYPKFYPFSDNFLCPNSSDFLPPDKELHKQNAKYYRIADYYVTRDLERMKSAISKNLPVIVAMQIPKSFEETKSMLWTPKSYESKEMGSGHAMVVIGYDDILFGGAFRIVNSWGDQWGDNGKIWIKYKDMSKWLDGACVMILPISTTYKSDNTINLEQNKLQPSKSFNSKNYNIKTTFNNKSYIDYFSKGSIN